MSKSGSTITYNDPFKQDQYTKTNSPRKVIRNDLGSGSFISSDPATQQLFVSDIAIDASYGFRNLFDGISDFKSLPLLTFSKNVFEEVTATDDQVVFGKGKGLFDEVLPAEKLIYSLDRILLDETNPSDFTAFSFGKLLQDNVNPKENLVLAQVKPLVDSADADSYNKLSTTKALFDDNTALDLFTKVVSYNRVFDDQALLDSKSRLLFTKNLDDYVNAEEFFVSSFTKFAADSAQTDDSVAFASSKLFKDTVYTADLIGIPDGLTYQFNTPEQANAAAVDKFVRVANYNRTFSEEFIFETDESRGPQAPQPFGLFSLFSEPAPEESRAKSTDILVYAAALRKYDSVVPNQFIALDLDKPLTDSTNPDQFISLKATKNFVESLVTSDDDTVQFGKNLFETIPSTDTSTFDVSKNVLEIAYSPDYIELETSLFKTDNYAVQDRIQLAYATSFSDQNSTSDDSVILTGKNLKETILTPDDQTFSVSKFLRDAAIAEDLVSIPDGVTYSSSKSLFDSASTQDYFTRVLVASRKIQDVVNSINDGQVLYTTKGLAHNTVLLDDQSFDVNKVLKDSAIASQQIAFSVDKPLEDSSIADQKIFLLPSLFKSDNVNNISDISNIDYTKVQRDSQALSDDLSKSFEKLFKDSVGIIDAFTLGDGLTYRFDSPERDTIAIGDVFKRVVEYGRFLEDSTLSTDDSTLSINLNKTDSLDIDQRISLVFSTSKFDDSNAEDFIALSPELFKEDDVSNISDNNTLNITLGRYENVSPSEFLAFSVAKELTDSSNVNQFISLAVSLGTIEDVIDSVSDDDTIQFTKAKYDSVVNSDNQVFDITKLIKDSVDTEDLVSVPDGATYYATKTLREFSSATDVFSLLLSSTRAFEEFKQATDSSTLSVGKTHLESLTAEETHTLDVFKPIDEDLTADQFISLAFSTSVDESMQAQDLPKLKPILYKSDLVGTSDNFTISFLVFRTFFDNAITQESLSFFASLVKSHEAYADEKIILSPTKFAEDSVENITDSTSLSPNLGKKDSSVASDSAPVFGISKLLKDDAIIDDLLSVPDGSTYYATKLLKDVGSNVADNFIRVLEYNRGFVDSSTVSSSIEFFSLSKRITEIVAPLQNISFDVSKSLTDESAPESFVAIETEKSIQNSVDNTDDRQVLSVVKAIENSVGSSDILDYNIIYRRTFESETLPESATFFSVSLVKEDSSDAVERIFLASQKNIVEVVDNISDSAKIVPELLKKDAVSTEQNITFDISKLLKDDAIIDDLLSVPDGSTYYATKLLKDSTNSTSDLLTRVVDYNRSFSHSATLNDDTIAFNTGKLLKDTQSTTDDDILSVGKNILDGVTQSVFVAVDFTKLETDSVENIGDTQALSVDLFKEDSATASELLTYILNYRRTFENSVSSGQFISFDVDLVKEDFASAEQFISLQTGKFLEDEITDFTDSQVLQPALLKKHSATATESLSFDFRKLLKDAANIDDLVAVPDGATYYATKKLTSFTNSTTDLFDRVVNYNRTFTDNVEFEIDEPAFQPFMMRSFATFATYNEPTGDSSASTDKIVFATNKELTDEFSTPDDDVLHIGKNILDDGVTQSVFVAVDFGKALSHKVENLSDSIALTVDLLLKTDTTGVSDDLSYTIIFRRTFKDSVVSSQFISLGVDLVKEDSAVAEQFVSLDTIKQFAHETNETTDLSVLKPALLKKHSATATESLSFGIGMLFKDDAVIDDLLSVPDGATYYAHKQIKDSTGSTSDKLTRVVDYNRLFNSGYGTSDDDVLSFGKFVESDSSTSDQFIAFDVDLFKEDSTTGLTDSIAAEFSKVLPIDYAYPEDKTPLAVTLGKTSELNDVHDLIDLTLIYNRFFAHSVTQSDDQTLTFYKNILEDDAVATQFVSLNIEKFVQNEVNIDDAISIDGLTYSISKLVKNYVKNIIDINTIAVTKFVESSVTLDDFFTLDGSLYSLSKLVEETFNTSDDQSFDISKLIKDDITLDDIISIDGSTYTLDKSIDSIINNISDDQAFTVIKSLTDTQSTSDDQSFDISKLIKSAITLSDAISIDGSTYTLDKSIDSIINNISDDQSFDISKLIKDGVTLDDAISLDGSTYSLFKLVKEAINTPDDQSFDISKLIKSDVTLDDAISIDGSTYTLEKSIENFVNNITDDQSFDISKIIKSDVTLDDAISLDGSTYSLSKIFENLIDNITDDQAYVVGKNLAHIQNTSDDQSFDISKLIKSSVTLDDAISIDGSTYNLSKLINDDFASTSDDQTLSVDKLLESLTNADEFATLETGKNLGHSVSNSDDDTLNVGKYLQHNVGSDVFVALDTVKFLDDDAYPVQFISLGTEKPFAHSVDNINDDDTLQFTKGINNVVSNSDDQTFDVSKLLKDNTIVDDLIGVPDGATYYASKKVLSSTQASERYSKVWNVIRKFENSSTVSEFVRIQSSINKEETLNTNDSETLNVGLFKSNAAVSIDASAFRFDKGDITDNVVSLEAARLEVTFGTIEDSVNNDDDSIELNSSLAKEDDAAATASGLLTVQNYTADAFYWAEDYVGESRIL
jgi:hypothetical protein